MFGRAANALKRVKERGVGGSGKARGNQVDTTLSPTAQSPTAQQITNDGSSKNRRTWFAKLVKPRSKSGQVKSLMKAVSDGQEDVVRQFFQHDAESWTTHE